MIIGIATISFFITRYSRTNSDKLGRAMAIMLNEMQKKLQQGSEANQKMQQQLQKQLDKWKVIGHFSRREKGGTH